MRVQGGSNRLGPLRTSVVAIEYHLNDYIHKLTDTLHADQPPPAGIESFFNTLLDNLTVGHRCCRCPITNTVVEIASHDEAVAHVVHRSLKVMGKAFKDQLNQTTKEGETIMKSNTRMPA